MIPTCCFVFFFGPVVHRYRLVAPICSTCYFFHISWIKACPFPSGEIRYTGELDSRTKKIQKIPKKNHFLACYIIVCLIFPSSYQLESSFENEPSWLRGKAVSSAKTPEHWCKSSANLPFSAKQHHSYSLNLHKFLEDRHGEILGSNPRGGNQLFRIILFAAQVDRT